jgi:hypothetical protein
MNLTILIHGRLLPTEHTPDPDGSIRVTPLRSIRYRLQGILAAGIEPNEIKLEELLDNEAQTQFFQELGTWLDTEHAKNPFPPYFNIGLDCILFSGISGTNPDLRDLEIAEEVSALVICGIHTGHIQTVPQEILKGPGQILVEKTKNFYRSLLTQINGDSSFMLAKAAAESAFLQIFGKAAPVTEPVNPEEDPIYCQQCGSCGESGCCNPSHCNTVILQGTYCRGNLLDYKQMEKEFCDMAEILAKAAKENPENEALQSALQSAGKLAPWILK